MSVIQNILHKQLWRTVWRFLKKLKIELSSVQFSSVTQLCPTICDPMDCSTPVLPVNRQLPEFTQTHVRWVSDAIQPSHPLSFPSPPAFNLSQHQGLFQWISSSHQVAKVLELQPWHFYFVTSSNCPYFRVCSWTSYLFLRMINMANFTWEILMW